MSIYTSNADKIDIWRKSFEKRLEELREDFLLSNEGIKNNYISINSNPFFR